MPPPPPPSPPVSIDFLVSRLRTGVHDGSLAMPPGRLPAFAHPATQATPSTEPRPAPVQTPGGLARLPPAHTLRNRSRGLQTSPRNHGRVLDFPGNDDRVRTRSRARHSSRDRHTRDQAYGNRIPLIRPGHRQSLYDWAPANPLDDVESRSLPPLVDRGDDIGREFASIGAYHPPPRDPLATHYSHNLEPDPVQLPLRTAALMHSLRHSARRPQRARTQRAGWVADRERDEESSRGNSSMNRLMSEVGSSESLMQMRWSGLGYDSGAGGTNLPSASGEVEEAIDYLERIRSFSTPQEGLRLAVRAGFNHGEDWLEMLEETTKVADLICETSFLNSSETSWLRAGGVFWGSQTTPNQGSVSQRPTLLPTPSLSALPTAIDQATGTQDGASRESPGDIPNFGHWAVKVCISSVDYAQMRLTGTMEAFTDGQTPPALNPPALKSISTYLEGEIIDFNIHTLKTFKNLSSTLKDDANNWRKLEPFLHMTNEEIVRSLVSRRFMKSLTENWVFMRWKEKCFISPESEPDMGALTIGGFYFLSLRRSDGRIQGYYFEPQSQPYQELNLKPQKRLFPAYEFR